MVEAISGMTIGELAGWVALLLGGLSTLIEITPIKLNPWTWMARKVGRAINGEVIAKVDGLEKDIKQLDYDAKEREAKAARARVLRFGDEILHKCRHSKEHFDDILQDITMYEKYCDEHPEFENERMQLTVRHIEEAYGKCLKENDFI